LAQLQKKDAESILGESGLAGQLKKMLAERMLAAELSHNLAREEGDTENYRNGSSAKTVLTPAGELRLNIPRDRLATFEPKLVRGIIAAMHGPGVHEPSIPLRSGLRAGRLRPDRWHRPGTRKAQHRFASCPGTFPFSAELGSVFCTGKIEVGCGPASDHRPFIQFVHQGEEYTKVLYSAASDPYGQAIRLAWLLNAATGAVCEGDGRVHRRDHDGADGLPCPNIRPTRMNRPKQCLRFR
jgi:hypothetical protein